MPVEPAEVLMYTLSGCVHCARARKLLARREIGYREISGDGQPDFRRQLVELSGNRTVPQILIDGVPVGGASQLAGLDRRGVLEARVRRSAFPIRSTRPASPLARLGARIRGRQPPGSEVWLDETGREVSRR